MYTYYGVEDYSVDYSGIPADSKPNLNRVINHAKLRFEQTFMEEWEGNYIQARSTFAALANKGLTERDMYKLVDWFYGLMADRCVHSFNLLRKLPDAYCQFMVDNKGRKRSGEDWYSYCNRIKNKVKARNQHQDTLDDLIYKICLNPPDIGVQ